MSIPAPVQHVRDLVAVLDFRASANPATMAAETMRALVNLLIMNNRAAIGVKDLLRMAQAAEDLNRAPFETANAPVRAGRDAGIYLVEVEAPARFWGSLTASSAPDAIRRAVGMIATEQRDDLAATFGQPTFTAAEKR
jgi:hypothetical protein